MADNLEGGLPVVPARPTTPPPERPPADGSQSSADELRGNLRISNLSPSMQAREAKSRQEPKRGNPAASLFATAVNAIFGGILGLIFRPKQKAAANNAPLGGNASQNAAGSGKRLNNPFARLPEKVSSLLSKLPNGWYIWLVGGGLLAGGYYLIQRNPQGFIASTGKTLHFPGTPGLVVTVSLALVAVLVDFVIGLVEARSREDPGLLDWWIPYVVVAVLVFGQSHGYDNMWWGFAAGASLCALVFATLWNPSEQQDPSLLDRLDTTAIFRTAFVLGLLYLGKWGTVPYPEFVPVVVVVVVGLLAIFKELMRTPGFALLIVVLGITAAVIYTPLWIFGTLAVAVIAANAGAHQGWIPTGQKTVEGQVKIFGQKIKLIMAWDVVIAWWASFILTAILIYHNPIIAIIGS